MPPAVIVENVSKKFILRHERHRSFQQVTIDFLTRRSHDVEEFWACRDISFTVDRGEAFGIIGANGSGKSTLLKLIARVIGPTTGRIWTGGRIAALIELGAGFHPDLTGRENVYLNGSFLGLSRREMDARFQRIVEFAGIGIEHFIDTPLKHFSSGMMMRLGFATAITVDADVLIIDEVLAVGDEGFQQKCFDALTAFKRAGGTILFVAHNSEMVRTFCDRALLLRDGQLIAIGSPNEVIRAYAPVAPSVEPVSGNDANAVGGPKDGSAEGPAAPAEINPAATIRRVRVLNADGEPVQRLPSGDALRIEIEYELLETFDRIIPGIQFISEREEYAYGVAADHLTAPATPGVHRVVVDLPTGPFVGGRFLICIGLSDRVDESGYHHVVYRDRQDSFEVVPVSREGGLVRFPTIWAVDGTASHAPIAFGPPVVAPRNGH